MGRHVDRSLSLIKDLGCQAGLVLNPATPLVGLDYILDEIDLVMLMSVNPGFGGQRFIESSLQKISQLRSTIDSRGLAVEIEVDGGISNSTIGRVAAAGATIFVAGSAIYGSRDYQRTIAELRDLAQAGATAGGHSK